MIRTLRQIVVVTLLNLRTVPQRLGASATTVLGVAGVVGVFVAVLSIGEGFRKTLDTAGYSRTSQLPPNYRAAAAEPLVPRKPTTVAPPAVTAPATTPAPVDPQSNPGGVRF